MLDGREYSFPSSDAEECFSGLNTLPKKKRSKAKRRFSDEQIRSLETMFESESKLEPPKKLELARELGLQPRQVAIWFQNKRARWKSKQLERDYSILRANYHTLASQFEALKKEKHSLVIQLQKLHNQMEKSEEGSRCCRQALARNSSEGKSEDRDNINNEFEGKPSCLSSDGSVHGFGVLSDDDISIKAEYFGLDEEPELLNMVEPADGSLTSPENWGNLDSDGLLDQSSSSYQWWDFWA